MTTRFGGAKVRLADKLGKSPSYIARCLSLTIAPENRKKIGEEFARQIEEALGLKRYEMDSPISEEGAEAVPPKESDDPFDSVAFKAIANLKGIVTPRSLAVIKRIEKAAIAGRLKETDLVLLEGIASRFEELNKDQS
jgi:hypothetical protein